MEDSTIHIYNIRMHEVEHVLVGHHKRVTGLAFSSYHEILVSSGADGQVFIWAADPWGVKRGSLSIEMPAGKIPTGDTNVQFNYKQNHVLVVQECQMALYDAPKMERICQWVPNNALSAPISHATYSCNGQLVITSFTDGNLGIFNAENLHLRCRISPSAYLASSSISSNPPVYAPVASHPLEPNQFAIGLSDGSVKVIEPLGSEGKWETPAPVDNSVPKGKKVRVRKCKRGRTGSSGETDSQGVQRGESQRPSLPAEPRRTARPDVPSTRVFGPEWRCR